MKKSIFLVLAMAFFFIFISSIAFAPEMEAEELPQEAEMFDRVAYYKENPAILKAKTQLTTDATLMATVVDAIAPDCDVNCKTAIFQLIVNRSKTRGFPNSIEEVCNQANQWQGMDSQSTCTEESFNLAKEFISKMDEYRIAPIGRDNVYLRVGSRGLYFRASWDDPNETFIGFYS